MDLHNLRIGPDLEKQENTGLSYSQSLAHGHLSQVGFCCHRGLNSRLTVSSLYSLQGSSVQTIQCALNIVFLRSWKLPARLTIMQTFMQKNQNLVLPVNLLLMPPSQWWRLMFLKECIRLSLSRFPVSLCLFSNLVFSGQASQVDYKMSFVFRGR